VKPDPSNAHLRLVWSQRLEELAERLYRDAEGWLEGDPLAKVAVVVGHPMRGEWLKEYHLFEREGAGRRILAGMDGMALHPFVGDWLYAALEGKDPKRRRPSSHPYSMEVLRWRIDGVLGELEAAGALEGKYPELAGYLAGSDGAGAREARRSALAAKLAEMYGDYQVHRPEMLARWEAGQRGEDATERWQAELWRRLRAQGGEPLWKQFARLEAGADLAAAFAHGIPRYRAVHVFGVSAMPRPYVAFFDRLAAVLPVTVYAFNPCEDFWLEDPRWRKAQKMAREEGGGEAEAEALAHPLLGTLATGCQGLLAEWLDRLEGQHEFLEAPEPAADTVLSRLQRQLLERRAGDERKEPLPAGDASVAVHRASTPRREMEVLRDGLLEWFAAHPGAHPRDAAVLCADWATYAPHAEAVFGAGGDTEAALPCTLLGRGAADDPIAESFLRLLEMAEGRMEADAVLDVLAEPAVASAFGIAAEDLPALRDFVRKANIRWGLDDAHVAEVMAVGDRGDDGEPQPGPFAFTWRRGLDRLLLSALGGPDAGGGGLVSAGALGELLPAGDAEADRATLLGRLCAYVAALANLRSLRTGTGTADWWQDRLLRLVADFFVETDANHRPIAALREAVATVAARMREADAMSGTAARHGWRVVSAAVAELVRGAGARPRRTPDSVLFAPLRAGIPSPRRLVWVCGLNDDGVFPRNEPRPAFDLMSRHPQRTAPSKRDDDALALLEAVCDARETLVLSHVGRDERSGKEVPPAPLAGALLDYLAGRFSVAGRKKPYLDFVHPLQGFSPRRFTDSSLPPAYSEADRAAARAIAEGGAKAAPDAGAFAFLPEEREEISLDELAGAFSDPAKAVLRTFASVNDSRYDAIDPDDPLEVDASLGSDIRLSLVRELPESEAARRGGIAAESGAAPDPESAAQAILNGWSDEERVHFRGRPLGAKDFPDMPWPVPADGEGNLLEMLEDASDPLAGVDIDISVPVPLPDGTSSTVRVWGRLAAVERRTADGGRAWYAPHLTKFMVNAFRKAQDWVRHLAANAAGYTLASVAVSGLSSRPNKNGTYRPAASRVQVLPPLAPDEARARLGRILALLCEPFPGAVPFLPEPSMQIAKAATDPSRDDLRARLRDEWFPRRFDSGGATAPGRPDVRPANVALWPASPAVLSDADLDRFVAAARIFWEGFPYL
jgi:exodeoxyribonuclease V gamma subunit